MLCCEVHRLVYSLSDVWFSRVLGKTLWWVKAESSDVCSPLTPWWGVPGSVLGVRPLFGLAVEGLPTKVSVPVWGWTWAIAGHSVSCFPRWAPVARDPGQLTSAWILASPSLSAELVYSTFFQEVHTVHAGKQMPVICFPDCFIWT